MSSEKGEARVYKKEERERKKSQANGKETNKV